MKYRHLEGYKYEVLKTEVVDTEIKGVEVSIPSNDDGMYVCLWLSGRLFVFPHYMWDGPSGPTRDDETNMRGSLIHDALYQLMREGLLDRKYRECADQLFKKICLEDGMRKFRAWCWYHGVRIFAWRRVYPSKNPRGKVVEI